MTINAFNGILFLELIRENVMKRGWTANGTYDDDARPVGEHPETLLAITIVGVLLVIACVGVLLGIGQVVVHILQGLDNYFHSF